MAAEPEYALPSPSASGARVDRVPPHNLDAEVSVIGSMLLSKDAIAEVTEHVRADDFYRGAHRTMFEAALALYDRGEPVDPVSLGEELKRLGRLDDVGGQVEISEIVHRVPTPANAAYYARIVGAAAIKRRLIDTGSRITQLGYDDRQDAELAMDSAENLIYQLAEHGRVGEIAALKDLLTAGFEMIEQLHDNQSALTGLATGFTDFDDLTSGLQPGNLVILAARPAMGKCVAAGTPILDPRTGAVRPIAELVEAGRRGERVDLVSAGSDLALGPTQASDVHDNGEKPVLAVRTRLGRELTVTANHPLLTPQGWRPAGELTQGCSIATPRALPYFGHDARPDAEVRLIAHLLGEHATVHAPPRLRGAGSQTLADVTACAAWFGVTVEPVDGWSAGCQLVAPPGERNAVVECLAEHGLADTDAADRFVPAAFFRLPRAQVAAFLNALLACGEHVDGEDGEEPITYTTVSQRLARQVQHLLLRFGVLAALEEHKRPDVDGPRRVWQLRLPAPDGVAAGRMLVDPAGEPARTQPAAAGVHWDEVSELVPAGTDRVYDLTVPGTHNFVADDVVVHNSTLVVNIASHVTVKLRKPVAMFSLEMSQMELVQRILAAQARVDSNRLRTGRLQDSDWPKLSEAFGKLADAPLFIDETPDVTMMEIRSKCRRLKQQHGLELVIVDYLQLMQSPQHVESRVQEVAQFSRGMKVLAKELNVPVIALSQLSRKPEDRVDHRPQLADLRESGSLEQDADIVSFIYRDEVYDPDSPAKGEAELIVAKHRNGPIGTIPLAFLGSTSRFASLRRGGDAPAPSAGGGAPL